MELHQILIKFYKVAAINASASTKWNFCPVMFVFRTFATLTRGHLMLTEFIIFDTVQQHYNCSCSMTFPLDLPIEQTIKNTTKSTPLLIFLKGAT